MSLESWVSDRELAELVGLEVAVVTYRCLYACCSRGWLPRDGYEQHYAGRLVRIEDGELLVQSRRGYSVRVQALDLADVSKV